MKPPGCRSFQSSTVTVHSSTLSLGGSCLAAILAALEAQETGAPRRDDFDQDFVLEMSLESEVTYSPQQISSPSPPPRRRPTGACIGSIAFGALCSAEVGVSLIYAYKSPSGQGNIRETSAKSPSKFGNHGGEWDLQAVQRRPSQCWWRAGPRSGCFLGSGCGRPSLRKLARVVVLRWMLELLRTRASIRDM